MKKLKAHLCTLLTLVFFTGCAITSAPTDDPSSPTGDLNGDLIFELATKATVSEGLNGDKEVAAVIVRVSDGLLEAIETGQITIPKEVDDRITALILDTDLEPGTKQSILTLTDSLAANYAARIDVGQLDPNTTAPVATVLTWVRDAAQDTIRFGKPVDYGAPPIPQAKARSGKAISLAALADATDPVTGEVDQDLFASQRDYYDRLPDTVVTTPYIVGNQYNPDLTNVESHWSDFLWASTSWFSGVSSYAELRDYHSSPLTDQEEAQWLHKRQLLSLNNPLY
jgi:hypothetical protein